MTYTIIRKIGNNYYRYEQTNNRIEERTVSTTTYQGKTTQLEYEAYKEKQQCKTKTKTKST